MNGQDQPAETVDDLMARMIGKRFFAAISATIPGGPGIAGFLHEHLHHQIALEKAGVLFASGPLTPRQDSDAVGLIVVRADDEAQARAILDADPFMVNGVRSYELFEWTINEGRITVALDFSDRSFTLD